MLTDALTTLSNSQAITATAASSSVIDLGAGGTPKPGHTVALTRDLVKGTKIKFRCQVTETFLTLTDLTVALQADNDEAFGSATTVLASAAIPLATLVAGYVFWGFDIVPRGITERYLRAYYTVGGSSATAGKIFAAVTLANQDNP